MTTQKNPNDKYKAKGRTIKAGLDALGKLFAKAERWTQNTYAKDIRGNNVSWGDLEATCFCLSGAIGLVCNGNQQNVGLVKVLDRAIIKITGNPSQWIVEYNDEKGRTAADIRKVVRVAKTLVRA